MSKKKYSEKIIELLKTVYDSCEKEDTAVRERQIRQWRRLKLLWEGYQRVWYSEVAHDWRIWDELEESDTDQAAYDKPVNVFKAYLETIIAALSVTVPPIRCYPDDATNTLDLQTAKAGDKIAQLVYRHNDVPLLWLHALFIFVTEGMTACYTYPKEDKAYGTYDVDETEEVPEDHEYTICSSCGHTIDDKLIQPNDLSNTNTNANPMNEMNQLVTGGMDMQQPIPARMTNSNPLGNKSESLENKEINEFMPDDEDAQLHAAINAGKELCPACMELMDPEIRRDKLIVERIVGTTTHAKSRMCMEAYGGLYVKVANYAKKQKDTPYLNFSQEIDYTLAMEEYKHIKKEDLFKKIEGGNSTGAYNQYGQWGRLSPQYQGEYPINVVTVTKSWIRPARFNVLDDEEDCKLLKKTFPDGVKVTYVNDEYAEACNESLDDYWTLIENPLSEYLHFDPTGQGLVSIQDITNDLISLVLQTIEHGIGQTFADPAVVNFKAYEQTEVLPGGVFPATPKSGKSLSDGFMELRTATLSGEVLPFYQQVQGMGQLTSGALPSLFGGQLEGSETASQYSMSRAQALQRLQNNWKMFTMWWKTIFSKVVPMYIKEMKDDERDVEKDEHGNFVNVVIRLAETEGKLGKIELEANENLPMTWGQRRDIIEKLLINANPEVIKTISAPENISLLHEYLGLEDFYVPGEDDVIKQYDEIKQLLDSEPIPTGDPNMPEAPSVDIDPLYDNHQIEFEIVRKWAISLQGRQTKLDNPKGYVNVLLHGKLHFLQMQAATIPSATPDNGVKSEGQPSNNTETPITENQDVNTVA